MSTTSLQPPPPASAPHYVRFLVPLAFFVLLVAVLAVGIKHSPEVGVIQSPLVGKAAPAWQLPMLTDSGRAFGSRDLRGQWYVLNVWGTWCPTCREEHETLLQISRSTRVPIIGIDWNDDDTEAMTYLAKLGNPYGTVTVDHDGRAAIDWGVYAAPETFLVDPHGMVVYKQIGAMTPDVWRREFAPRLPGGLAAGS
ncbi:MAG TPA: DsbE family thiol:disulfide interchange protein [Steroidobacteraceae bacterium]|nr:DsbE family thiol:disulfide interchange protein [Steroidobacteraceae bacterium]